MCRELIKIIEFSYLFTFSFGAIRQLKLPFAVLIRYFKPVPGFVAQIMLRACFPLPQTDLVYSLCSGYAKCSEAI